MLVFLLLLETQAQQQAEEPAAVAGLILPQSLVCPVLPEVSLVAAAAAVPLLITALLLVLARLALAVRSTSSPTANL